MYIMFFHYKSIRLIRNAISSRTKPTPNHMKPESNP